MFNYLFSENFPPNITADGVVNGTLVLYVRVGEPIIPVQLYASDANGDPITFNLTEEVPGASLGGMLTCS